MHFPIIIRIAEFIILLFFRLPGACIRWGIFRKRTFRAYVNDPLEINAFPVICMVVVMVIALNVLIEK